MNKLTPSYLLFLLCLYFLFSCNKELNRKSFVNVDNLSSFVISKNEVLITFNLSDIEEEDPIIDKWIKFWLTANANNPDSIPIGLDTNRVLLENLIPDTLFNYQVGVRTSDLTNNVFESAVNEFRTPAITVVTDSLITELDKELKLTAFGYIIDFEEDDKNQLDSVGHLWIAGTDTIAIGRPPTDISPEGLFKTELAYYDFKTMYAIQAVAWLKDKGPVISSTIINYESKSNGDFWVNIAALASPGDEYMGPLREGAVSFVIDGTAYMGLGRSNFGDYDLSFYAYDASKNKWQNSGQNFPTPKGRMHAVSFQDDAGNVYVGTGCNPCEGDPGVEVIEDIGFLSDFYKFDATTKTWDPSPIFSLVNGNNEPPGINRDDDKDGKERFGFTELDDEGRFGAYAFMVNNQAFVGGGLGKVVAEVDFNQDGVVNEMEWIDYNQNEVLDLKEWVNIDGDTILDIGEWQDDGDGILEPGEFQSIDDTLEIGEWKAVIQNNMIQTIAWNDAGIIGVLEAGEWIDYNRNFTVDNVVNLPDNEWVDQNGNGVIDPKEVTYELVVKEDLWEINPNSSGNWNHKSDRSENAVFGAAILEFENRTYRIVGDTYPPSPANSPSIVYRFNSMEQWEELNLMNPLIETRTFPIVSVIKNYENNTDYGFVGAGEYNDTTLVSFDYWEFQDEIPLKVTEVSACGLLGLTKGVSFAIGNKIYAGFGVVREASGPVIKDEFWVYIPCLKNCN